MSYVDVTVICEGAVEREWSLPTWHEAESYATHEIEQYAAEAPDATIEIYLMYHDHENEILECECAQYVTDHRPYYTNRREP